MKWRNKYGRLVTLYIFETLIWYEIKWNHQLAEYLHNFFLSLHSFLFLAVFFFFLSELALRIVFLFAAVRWLAFIYLVVCNYFCIFMGILTSCFLPFLANGVSKFFKTPSWWKKNFAFCRFFWPKTSFPINGCFLERGGIFCNTNCKYFFHFCQ